MNKYHAFSVVLAVSALGSVADAGQRLLDKDNYVNIIPGGATPNTFGAFGSVRRSPDQTQYIGCSLAGTSVSCYAKDSTGQTLSCTGTTPNVVAAVKALDSSSFLAFTTDATKVTCVNVVVDNFSWYSPK